MKSLQIIAVALLTLSPIAARANTSDLEAFSLLPLPFKFSEADMQTILEGGTATRLEPHSGTTKEGIAVAVIPADAEVVLRTISDCPRFHEFMPAVHECRVVAQFADHTEVFQSLKLPLPYPFRTKYYRVRSSRPVWTETDTFRKVVTEWRYVPGSGNIVDTAGSWTIVQLAPARSLVCYRALADLGLPLPGFVVNFATSRLLPRVLEAVKKQAVKTSQTGARLPQPGRLGVVSSASR